MVHLRLLSTSPRGDAVTFGFRSENLDLEGTSTPPTQDTLRRTPLPACPAGETVRQLERPVRASPDPLPACPAGEAVQAARAHQAAELLHLPDKPAGVDDTRTASASWRTVSPAGQAGRGLAISSIEKATLRRG